MLYYFIILFQHLLWNISCLTQIELSHCEALSILFNFRYRTLDAFKIVTGFTGVFNLFGVGNLNCGQKAGCHKITPNGSLQQVQPAKRNCSLYPYSPRHLAGTLYQVSIYQLLFNYPHFKYCIMSYLQFDYFMYCLCIVRPARGIRYCSECTCSRTFVLNLLIPPARQCIYIDLINFQGFKRNFDYPTCGHTLIP